MTFVPVSLCPTLFFNAHSFAWNSLMSIHTWTNFRRKHLLHVPSIHIVPCYWHRHKSRFWLAKYLVESFGVFLAVCALTPLHPEGPQWQSALQGQQTNSRNTVTDLQKQTATQPSGSVLPAIKNTLWTQLLERQLWTAHWNNFSFPSSLTG